MPSRIITGTLYKHSGEAWANARLDFTLITDTAIRPGEALPVWSRTVYTTSAGAIPAGVSLEVPATDAWRYRLKIESNTTLEFYLTDGPPITIDEVVILAGQGGSEPVSPEWPFLVNLYTSTQMADEDDIATADGAGNIVFRKLSALLGSVWTWLQAAIGAVPDGSDLISTDDPRLSDARTPTAHAATHAATGSDPIAPGDIGAMPVVSPAVAGNLVVQAADGTLVDAGYAAGCDGRDTRQCGKANGGTVAFEQNRRRCGRMRGWRVIRVITLSCMGDGARSGITSRAATGASLVARRGDNGGITRIRRGGCWNVLAL
jgi:hypothetical protein